MNSVQAARSGLPVPAWRSADINVPSTRLSPSLGDRTFPVAAALSWSSLPSAVRDADTLTTFRQHLKIYLLINSFD